MEVESYENRKGEVMKRKMLSFIMIIMAAFILGMTSRVLATNLNIDNEEETRENYLENATEVESNTQIQGTNAEPTQAPETGTTSTDYINDLSERLQNMASKQQPKDMRRQVAVTVIIIVTVLLIIGLVTWYYMTNQ